MITLVWDTWLKPGAEDEGLRLTRQVFIDLRDCDGYVSHQIFIDQAAPRHIITFARWRGQVDVETVREKYADSETISQLRPLLAWPKDCWVTHEDQPV